MTQLNEALKDALDESLDARLPPRERRWLKWLRRAGLTLAGLYFAVVLALLAARFVVLPGVAAYKDEIAAAVSRGLGERVEIGSIRAEWFGFHPRLELGGVKVFDRRGDEALELPHVAVSVAWRSIGVGELRFKSILIEGAELQIRRDADRRLFVAGLEVRDDGTGDRGLADWVLNQGEILIRGAKVEWRDDYRGAPPLRLERLEFLLQNEGRHHRFALSAAPPQEFASAIDVRGDLTGRTVTQLAEWDGRFYTRLDSVDLAAWRTWVDYPFEVTKGRGALQLWVGLSDQRLTELAATVSLADVAARFGPALPPFEASVVHGRFGFKKREEGLGLLGVGKRQVVYDAFARELKVALRDGPDLAPADFTARLEPAQGREPPKGELLANSIELAPLALVAERLPLPENLRRAIVAAVPQGRVTESRFAWTGDIERPLAYSARGRFADLGMLPVHGLPGFDRLAGSFEVSERAGIVAFSGARTTITQAALFAEESVAFDMLSARVNWTASPDSVEVRIEDVAFANAELSGNVSGTLRAGANGRTEVDIAARVPKAAGNAIYKYIPRLGPSTAAWLKRGIVAGTASDVRVRVRGDVDAFPFDDPKHGEFRVTGKVAGGELDYAAGWPRIRDVAGELEFVGRRLNIVGRRAQVLGVQLARVKGSIPDYIGDEERLLIDGEAEGPLGEFLRFIAESPVDRYIDRATAGWSGEGRAKLALRLDLPLSDMDRSKVAGTFQFAGNTVNMGPDEPLLSQVNGRFEFTESGVRSQGLTAQTLGGSVAMQLATRDGGVGISVNGTVDASQLMRQLGLPLAEQVRGPLAFRYSGGGFGPGGTRVFESSLAGVAVDLPAPFGKPAADAAPLRVERTPLADTAAAPRRERVTLTVGSLIRAQGVLRAEAGGHRIERAAVVVGAGKLDLPGTGAIAVAVDLKSLDLDRFLPLLYGAQAGTAEGHAKLTDVSVRAGRLDVGGRRFNDVALRAHALTPSGWQAVVSARELAGDVTWRPDGKGRVVARLTHLAHPDAAPDPAPGSGNVRELPALDIVADSYSLNGRALGRLALEAANEQQVWRLSKLELAAPEGRLAATGSWRSAPRDERSDLDVRIETSDAGKYLARFGQPDTIAQGAATLGAKVTWNGPVYAIDFPSLTGEIDIRASRGQFLKVNPGLGKLLGVVSLQSLPRRMAGDFDDIFGEGFAFDEITGTAAIRKGVATTKDLTMVGPAASVAITGTVDLARETQDLNVRVVPSVGDSVAAAAALALLNPLVGVGALLAQRVLKDPIGQILAYEYHVSGGWEDPRVERLRSEPPAQKPEGQNP